MESFDAKLAWKTVGYSCISSRFESSVTSVDTYDIPSFIPALIQSGPVDCS